MNWLVGSSKMGQLCQTSYPTNYSDLMIHFITTHCTLNKLTLNQSDDVIPTECGLNLAQYITLLSNSLNLEKEKKNILHL